MVILDEDLIKAAKIAAIEERPEPLRDCPGAAGGMAINEKIQKMNRRGAGVQLR
jgi:hypothetical protein